VVTIDRKGYKMNFTRAEKKKSKLRLAIYGPSGAGKTLSSLLIAKGIGGSIALIDTEHGRAAIYADRAEYDTLELQDKTISGYITAINAAAQAGYQILVIDSLSHAWKELIEEMDRITDKKFKGNSFRAWSEGTPQQNRMIDAILKYPGHIIATMRSKTEYVVEQVNGKSAPRKIGLAPEQGKGLEYEFNLLLAINQNHFATIEKDNTGGDFQDVEIDKPGVEFGKQLVALLDGSAYTPTPQPPAPVKPLAPAKPANVAPAPEKVPPRAPEPVKGDINKLVRLLKLAGHQNQATMLQAVNLFSGVNVTKSEQLTDEQIIALIAHYTEVLGVRDDFRKLAIFDEAIISGLLTEACTEAGLLTITQPVCLEAITTEQIKQLRRVIQSKGGQA
jgi:hypothetical protein